jgi:hypothetical protein
MYALPLTTRMRLLLVSAFALFVANIAFVDAATLQLLVNFDGGTANDLLGNHHGALEGAGTSIGGDFASLSVGLIRFANPKQLDFSTSYKWHLRFRSADSSGCLLCRTPDGSAWNQGS